jgi:hypothetical protein
MNGGVAHFGQVAAQFGSRWMHVPIIDVTVPGQAAGLTAARTVAEPWKIAVADAVRRQWTGGYLSEPCVVRLTFNVGPARFRDTAIFNLLKSVIDGLSHVIFAPDPSGQPGPWARQDWWVDSLSAEKRLASGPPSVRIQIGPVDTPTPDLPGEALASLFLPGRPPLWPGDQAGQERVLRWRAQCAEVLRAPSPLAGGTLLYVALDFALEPARLRRADLDNLCVPAAQAVAFALFGDLRHAPSITSLRATKRPAGDTDAVGVQVSVWPVAALG